MHNNQQKLTPESDGIRVQGHRGTWYVIDTYYDETLDCELFLLEHEKYGDEAACIIVNEDCEILQEDIWNGFEDYFEMMGYDYE